MNNGYMITNESRNAFLSYFGFTLCKSKSLYIIQQIDEDYKQLYRCRRHVMYGSIADILKRSWNLNEVDQVIAIGDICVGIEIENNNNIIFEQYYNVNDIYDVCVSTVNKLQFVFVSQSILGLQQTTITRSRQNIDKDKFEKVEGVWDFENPCYHCGYVFLTSQDKKFRKKCCRNGAVLKSSDYNLPPLLASYCAIDESTELFLKHQCVINNIIAYGNVGVDTKYNSRYINTNGGDICLGGRTYCTYKTPGGFHTLLYFVNGSDEEFEISQLLDKNNVSNDPELIDIIKRLLGEQNQVNVIAEEIASIYDRYIHSNEAIIEAGVEYKVPMSIYDVSIYKNNDDKSPIINLRLKNNYGSGHKIQAYNNFYEPLLYVLFYPYGEKGFGSSSSWQQRKEEKLSLQRSSFWELNFPDYICHLIMQPEQSMSYINPETGMVFPCNRFNIWNKLSQFWLVDMLSRNIDQKLSFAEKVNSSYFDEHLSGYAKSRSLSVSDKRKNDDNENVEEVYDDYVTLEEANNDDSNENVDSDVINDDIHDLDHDIPVADGEYLDDDDDDNDDDSDKKFVLSASITGSVRHLQRCARNALHVVSVEGKPSVFITLTANPEWPEIKSRLGPGQSAYNRPDITMQVFHERLSAVLKNLRRGKYFDENNLVKYEVRVTEYQHRGLPHAHIVMALTNMPTDIEGMKAWIDRNISTEGTNFDESEAELEVLVKKFMVHTCRPQNPSNPTGCLNTKGHCRKRFHLMEACAECKFDEKGFPVYKRTQSNLKIVTYNKKLLVDWNGHANVCFTENSYTVNYLYGYIFKGNRKVKSRIKVGSGSSSSDGDELRNEYTLYVKCRKICSMDAMNRFLGYPTYPASNPPVLVVKAQLPEMLDLILSKGSVCALFIYFNRCHTLRHLTYQAFHQLFKYQKASSKEISEQLQLQKKKKVTEDISVIKKGIKFTMKANVTTKKVVSTGHGISFALNSEIDDDEHDSIAVNPKDIITATSDSKDMIATLPNITYTKIFRLKGKDTVYRLIKKTRLKSLVRIESIPLRAGELAYLQMLLADNPDIINDQSISNRCPISYKDLKTFEGKLYNSFQEVAIACGIVKNPKYVTEQFKIICRHINACSSRRKHFYLWTKEDLPTLHIFNDGNYEDENGYIYKMLVQDWIDDRKGLAYAKNEIKNKFLNELQQFLLEDSCRENILEFYGFPKTKSVATELDLEFLRYDTVSQHELVQQLEIKFPYNDEQSIFMQTFKRIFDELIDSAEDSISNAPLFMYLNGAGGTGKTTLLTIIAAYVRSKGQICKIAAATGLAATNYDDACTFHSLCKIPIVEGEERDIETHKKLTLKLTKQRLELLLATRVVILDELPFNHRECIESFYDCQELKNLEGKIIIGAGDFRQLFPVLEGASRDEIIGISLPSSPVWEQFKNNMFTLKKNMRLQTIDNIHEHYNQRIYSEVLESIGNGSDNCQYVKVTTNDTCITKDEQLVTLTDVKSFVLEDKVTVDESLLVIHDTLKWLYGIDDLSTFHPQMATECVILANTNVKVDSYNRIVQELNENTEKVYKSYDSLADVQDNKRHLATMLTEETLNKKNSSSAPKHELTLRLKDMCILTRNISIKDGLVNNARVKILQFFKNTVLIETLDKQKTQFFLPRIKFKFSYSYGTNFAILRQQIPLKLCYAFTVHKVQGQTMSRILFDLTEPVFCHGALYVALSRIRKYSNISFIVKRDGVGYDEIHHKDSFTTKNIVYKSVLDNIFR